MKERMTSHNLTCL